MVARWAAVFAGYYRSITLDQPANDLTDFPVLFYGTFSYLKTIASGGLVNNINGYDITFYSDASLTTLLAFERVYWDGTTGDAEFRIKVPTLTSASPTVIYIAYGNTSKGSDLQNAAGVWSNNYQGVYHLPNGTVLTANDSTSNANNGTLVNTPTAIAGKIDGGANCVRASNQYINLGNPASLQITGNLTIECWVNPTTLNPEMVVAKDGNVGGRAYTIDVDQGNLRFYINGGSGGIITGGTILSMAVWQHVVAVYNTAGTLDIYLNGVTDATQVTGGSTSIPAATADVYIGRRVFATSENNFDGGFDEVRISNTSRTAVYVATIYSNENDPANFYAIGSETAA